MSFNTQLSTALAELNTHLSSADLRKREETLQVYALMLAVNYFLTNGSGGGTPVDLGFTYSLLDRSGTCSSTTNTYTQLMPANVNRTKWAAQNTHASAVLTIAIGSGLPGAEVPFVVLNPGDSIEQDINSGIIAEKLVIKSTVSSSPYLAHENA
jgi:hypothetical protein